MAMTMTTPNTNQVVVPPVLSVEKSQPVVDWPLHLAWCVRDGIGTVLFRGTREECEIRAGLR